MSESEGSPSQHLVGTKPPEVRELTVRTFIVAIIIAVLMGASYPYIVLKLGFGPNVSVVAAFFGFLILFFARGFTRWENNLVQTAGTSSSQVAFMCILLAAYDMLRATPGSGFTVDLTPMQSFVWITFAGLLGVLLAVPLRHHYIVDEKLTFADGVAAGETLIVLDSKGPVGRRAALFMGVATLVSGAYFAVREEGLLLKGLINKSETLKGLLGKALPDGWEISDPLLSKMGVGISYGLLSLGSGALVGIRINASMMLGALLSWVIAPLALTKLGWLAADPTKREVLFWVMWPAVGMLIAAGVTSLVMKWNVLIRSFKALTGAQVVTGDVSMRFIIIGSLLSSLGLIVSQWVSLGIAPWLTVLSIILSLPLMLVGLRMLGETNWGPISTLANVMQAAFAVVAPGNLDVSMVTSGTSGTIATSSEAIMQDYKAGHMIGSTPRQLTVMQLIGVPIGAACVAWTYPYLRDTYGIIGEHAALSSPASERWAGFALVLRNGLQDLPPHTLPAFLGFAVLGALLTLVEGNEKLRPYTPSATGIGIGMLVPFNVVSTMFIGGVMGWAWEKKDRKSSDVYATPIYSGLIAGEAIVAVIVSILAVLKVIDV